MAKKTGKRIIINIEHSEVRVAILENNILTEYYIETNDCNRQVGNIYKGEIESVIPGIQSAFIKVGLEKNAFLYVSDVCFNAPGMDIEEDEEFDLEKYKRRRKKMLQIEDVLKSGEDILIQVEKDPINTKGVKVTSYISLPGRFAVLMPNIKHRGISKKINNWEERKRLNEILDSAKFLKDYGCILRTVAGGMTKKQILSDMKYLVKIWNTILKGMKKQKSPALLHEESDLIIRIVRDHFTDDINEFIIDSKESFNKVKSFLGSTVPNLKSKLKLYTDEEPIFDYYNLEREIKRIYKKTAPLKCGGYLVIEQTEALVAIDVNTGKHLGKGGFEETVLKTNLEAAEEIARQLKLRDIGGIIIIDFIDMKFKKNRIQVHNKLGQCLRNDKSRSNILQISNMGLLEMTRQRRGRGVYKTMYEYCPYCEGTGYIKSVASITVGVLRKLRRLFVTSVEKDFIVYLHPGIVDRLLAEDRENLILLEKRFNKKADIRREPECHIEEFRILSGISKEQITI